MKRELYLHKGKTHLSHQGFKTPRNIIVTNIRTKANETKDKPKNKRNHYWCTFCFSFFFRWYWSLISAPCSSQARTLSLEPRSQPLLFWFIFQIESLVFFPDWPYIGILLMLYIYLGLQLCFEIGCHCFLYRLASKCDPPISTSHIAGIACVNHCSWSHWYSLNVVSVLAKVHVLV
jgi:hypothetical protein